jgi:excisionase family DNA binding protein
MEDLLTYAQASTHLNLKLGTLYALVSQGRVPHVRLGRRLVRFSPTSLDAWLRAHAVTPAGALHAAHGEPEPTAPDDDAPGLRRNSVGAVR